MVPYRRRLRGAALLSRSGEVQALFQGSEHADSFVVDPHKWLFAPFDCAALLYREPALAKAVHAQHASYLDPIHTGASDEWNPSDYAYHLTRRARGLALWYSLVVNGTDAYSGAVDAALSMARVTARLIAELPVPGTGARPGAVHRAVPPQGMGSRLTMPTGRPSCSTTRWHS